MILEASTKAAGPSFRVGARAEVLGEVRGEGVDIALWRRAVPPSLSRTFDGWVAAVMLKGSRHPNAGGRGAVHRSPPIEHGGARRFVLIVTAGGPTP